MAGGNLRLNSCIWQGGNGTAFIIAAKIDAEFFLKLSNDKF
jgi:hypothetical protein